MGSGANNFFKYIDSDYRKIDVIYMYKVTIDFSKKLPVSSVGRASDFESEGQGFESRTRQIFRLHVIRAW